MVDALTIAVGVLAAVLIIALIIGIVWVAFWILRENRRRRAYERAGTSHLDLYFKDRFPNIIEEFDLVTNPRFDQWSNGVTSRLSNLSRDIDLLGKARQGLDTRMDRLEQRIGEVE